MGQRLFSYIFIVFFIIILITPAMGRDIYSASSGQDVKDVLSRNNVWDICGSVKKTIREGTNARIVARTAVELGHSVCLVVKCAISGGGNIEDVITGAIEAGGTSDVVSRCAIDAGGEAGEVAKTVLKVGLSPCYFEPQGRGYSPPEDNPTPPFIPQRPVPKISPSSF